MTAMTTRMKQLFPNKVVFLLMLTLVIVALTAVFSITYADVPGGRPAPTNATVPNPGTQQQELANITFPAPYNAFEFVVTCAACHGGTIDQAAGHFGNWAGSAHANAMRDPVFRANQQIVNQIGIDAGLGDGAGNICIRCHSPNAWYSGRTDPKLAGEGDASNAIHSIVLSTDDEGILCEFCHRVIGGVTMQDPEISVADPAWNMMAGIDDWPHAGLPYPEGPLPGNPYGDATFQINDGMTYGGKYPGSANIYFSDIPLDGTSYTGQTYAVYPPGWKDQFGNDISGQPAVAPDGSVPLHFEAPIGPPADPVTGLPDYQGQAFSPEHTTFEGTFIKTSEFCGGCHDLTIPVLNHGMPEQRTYTEWKYSAFNTGDPATDQRCQDCHMPSMMHEYADDIPVSLNADPVLSGWFPYAKDRSSQGGTAFHKFSGANRDLPMMMSVLYPEVDLEIIGAQTGNDVRIFPGMLSDRSTMWLRAQRNAEIEMNEAVDLAILSLTEVTSGVYEVQVQVTNNAGHRIPTGYPDGRRFFLSLNVTDALGNNIYTSGYYDEAAAQLYDDATSMEMDDRALSNIIDATSGDNQVMIYEKRTGTCDAISGTCVISVDLLNNTVIFDNRIPPLGYDYNSYSDGGTKFVTYDPATFSPFEVPGRFAPGANYDVVTYRFAAAPGLALTADVAAYWQTHTREFMEHLRTNNTATDRPEGPPNILDPNYPLTPNYLSDNLPDFEAMTSLDGSEALRDNWGGVAYGAWLVTGKGAPYQVGHDSTDTTAPPAAPSWVQVVNLDPFSVQLDWEAVPNADGYEVMIRYGASDLTASWDRLAIVYDGTTLVNDAMNIGKTYGFKVVAFNGKGEAESPLATVTTPIDLPAAPINTQVIGTTESTVTLSWFDQAELEIGFIIQRQDVPVQGDFYEVARIPSQTEGGATGGNSWTDLTVASGMTYNYRVAAYNDVGQSTWDLPVTASTGGVPQWPITGANLAATAVSGNRIDLTWSAATGTPTGYRVERATNLAGPWTTFVVPDPNAVSYTDLLVNPSTTYYYRVYAYNFTGTSVASNVASATTPAVAPAAPSNLTTLVSNNPTQVTLNWTDNATNETGFYVERADGVGVDLVWARIATVNGANITTYIDATVNAGLTYSYRVQAFAAGGTAVSGYSNAAEAVVAAEIPGAPSGLRVVQVRSNQITLSWLDNSTSETRFDVYRSTNGVNFSLIGSTGTDVATYRDRAVSSNTRYWYYVVACNSFGCSEASETVDARTRR